MLVAEWGMELILMEWAKDSITSNSDKTNNNLIVKILNQCLVHLINLGENHLINHLSIMEM